MNKSMLTGLAMGLVAALAIVVFFSLQQRSSWARKYARIKSGMSIAEVDAIMGRPPDIASPPPPRREPSPYGAIRWWNDPQALVHVWFDHQYRVMDMCASPNARPTWLDLRLARLGMNKDPEWLDRLRYPVARLGTCEDSVIGSLFPAAGVALVGGTAVLLVGKLRRKPPRPTMPTSKPA